MVTINQLAEIIMTLPESVCGSSTFPDRWAYAGATPTNHLIREKLGWSQSCRYAPVWQPPMRGLRSK